MDKKELVKLFSTNTLAKKYGKGQVIVEEGDMPSEGVGFLLAGEARVFQTQGNRRVPIGLIRSGQFFGETAIVLSRPRLARVEVISDSATVMFISAQHFLNQSTHNHHLLEGLIDHAKLRVEYVQSMLMRYTMEHEYPIDPTLIPIMEENRQHNLNLVQLLNHTRSAWIGTNKTVFLQGDRNDEQTFLVVKGSITAVRQEQKKYVPLITYKEGDIFGYSHKETSPLRRFSTMARHDAARIISFDEELLYRLLRANPSVFFYFLRSIITDLVILNDSLRMVTAKNNQVPGCVDTFNEIIASLHPEKSQGETLVSGTSDCQTGEVQVHTDPPEQIMVSPEV